MREIQQRKLMREEAILLSLKKLDYLSRSQIQRLHNLGGDRNARRVIDNMSAYLSSFRGETGENIYYLSKDGRDMVNCDVIRHKTIQANHYLMRADACIHYDAMESWKNEPNYNVPEKQISLVPDSTFMHSGRRHFLEIDHLQRMVKNQEKIKRYKALHATGVCQSKFGYFPRLVWVTATESRKAQLLEWCAGLDVVVHAWNEII